MSTKEDGMNNIKIKNVDIPQRSKKNEDPYRNLPPNTVAEGDYVLLIFADKRQIFAQALTSWRGKSPPLKINKRSYNTYKLIGLTYGTVLEVDTKQGLIPLPDGEDIIPHDPLLNEALGITNENGQEKDNRDLIDSNKSQKMTEAELVEMRSDPSISGSTIVKAIIQNSSTFDSKTSFSKAKYIQKKQIKYQPRCRLTKCTAGAICRALHIKDPRRMMNLRDDSLAQILSFANISAGCKILCFDTCNGVVTGACAQRIGGYGIIHSLFTGHSPGFIDMIGRFNLSFCEHSSIKWLHTGQVFHDDVNPKRHEEDYELADRKRLVWPCCLQAHTQKYVEKMTNDKERIPFMNKRASRFARKLTRPTSDEVLESLQNESKKCDSLILACQYDPTHTLLTLLPYLETSCPFVVFYEYLEPLVQCFQELQNQKLAINLRLTDTWMREYQILPNRTHPNMNMSQNGGFILTGVKLCPIHSKNDIDDEIVKNFRRRIRASGKKRNAENNGDSSKRQNKKQS